LYTRNTPTNAVYYTPYIPRPISLPIESDLYYLTNRAEYRDNLSL
jgi:hypothetical protein